MKNLFPGYFTPSETEFNELWQRCIFAFDTNVLLGLYRSTSATQKVFFDILEKISDRIFLPYQAAFEYLRGRLGVISVRSDSFGKIVVEAEKVAKFIESTTQEHSLRNGPELAGIARKAANEIRELAEASGTEEPDLVRTDPILEKLAKFFEKHTGDPYAPARLTEIYAEAAQRYAKGVPPGFKDEKKPEPERYGDVVIWFQLIDNANATKKPLIFVTGDGKDDWWHKHRGDVLGPRPELRQEMMNRAEVSFYMYTVPRFLEFANQFLDLEFDTKTAETEFENIEKQDKEAAERAASEPDQYYYQDIGYQKFTPAAAINVSPVTPVNCGFANPTNYAAMQPSTFFPMQSGVSFYGQPPYTTLGTRQPYGIDRWDQPGFIEYGWPEPVDSTTKNKLFALLPINGYVYHTSNGKWKCEITGEPSSDKDDPAYYNLKFERQDVAVKPRQVKLIVSLRALEQDSDWRYKTGINRAITRWLSGAQTSSEVVCLP